MKNISETFWIYLKDILSWRRLEGVLKTSWQDVLKTYDQDEYTGPDQDVFWRLMSKANIFALMKTSWRRLLKTKTKDVFKTSSSRQMFAGIMIFWFPLLLISCKLIILLLPVFGESYDLFIEDLRFSPCIFSWCRFGGNRTEIILGGTQCFSVSDLMMDVLFRFSFRR